MRVFAKRALLVTRLTVLLAVLVAVSVYVLPRGERAAQLHLAANDPARLADLRLAEVFDAAFARREIAQALDAGDVELAESFVALAVERGVAVPADLRERLAVAQSSAMRSSRTAASFGRGFAIGQADDTAGLLGAAAGDLIGWGDVRDLARESWHAMSGEDVNRWLVGLSAAGLAVTAWTYFSVGAAVPVREGMSVVKAAARSGRLGKGLVESAGRAFASGKAERIGVAVADLGALQGKAGTRAAVRGLGEATNLAEVGKLRQLAHVKGRATLAILKTLGRNSFVLGAAAVTAAGWLFAALFNLFLLVVAIQKGFLWLVRKIWPRPATGWRVTKFDGDPVAVAASSD